MKRKACFTLIFWHLIFCDLPAQQRMRHELVVAYVYNFAKTLKWQNEADLKEYRFTVVTRNPAYKDEFLKLSKARTLKDKPISITFTENAANLSNTQLVFLDKDFENSLMTVFSNLEGKNVLLITDQFSDKRFVMINFVESGNNKLMFDLNKANMINQNFEVPSDLILLGGSEIDVASLYKESQQSLLTMQKEIDKLTSQSEELQSKISASQAEIEKQNKLTVEQKELIQKQQAELSAQQQKHDLLQTDVERKTQLVEQKKEELLQKEKTLASQENKLSEQERHIKSGKQTLSALKTSIDSLNSSVQEKERILNQQGYQIASQSKILYGLITIVALALFSIFMLLKWYRQKNRLNKLLTVKRQELLEANDELEKKSGMLEAIVEELNTQRQELAIQHDLVSTQNEQLIQSQEEISAQRDIVSDQNKKLEESRSIIEKQNAEIMLRNANLEAEVENRTKELVEYNHQLEQFAFISAHNLRAPVARILGLGQLLELANPGDEKVIHEKLILTTKELDRVVRDLNTILEIRKNNESVLTEVNLDEELALLKISLGKEIDDTRTKLESDFTMARSVRTVRPYLTSILTNLVSNAIKYRQAHTTPVIKIKTRKTDNNICITVSDNGLGIDLKSYEAKLFKLYGRFHHHVDGKGIGLYLVKTQVSVLGGRIEVESEVNKGTTFNVYLKAEP